MGRGKLADELRSGHEALIGLGDWIVSPMPAEVEWPCGKEYGRENGKTSPVGPWDELLWIGWGRGL